MAVMIKNYTFFEEIDSVLERLGGNEELLVSLVEKFRERYHDTRPQLAEMISSARNEDAYRIVHSIKGVAGNLGMGELYRSAVSLENRFKAEDYSMGQEEYKTFAALIERVIREMDEKKAGSADF